MALVSLSDAHAAALKQLAEKAGVTVDQLAGEWIARYDSSLTALPSRAEREQRLRELEGKYDLGGSDVSLRVGEIMRGVFSTKHD
jgi:hypothetical protein